MVEDRVRSRFADGVFDIAPMPLVAVLITTLCGRVYGGYLDIDPAQAIGFGQVNLLNARECKYGGFTPFGGVFGLATTSEPLLGLKAIVTQLTIYDVSSIIIMTKEAEIAWQEAPIYEAR
jgi:hypothetical protein